MWDIARGRKFYLEYHKYPLLFNIFLRDLFWIICETDFVSYADDNTPYASGDNTDKSLNQLRMIQ